jgi:dUTP pyrophosphatase
MEIKIKKLDPNAVIPSKAHASDAGLDLTATSKGLGISYIEYGTGLAVEIPAGYAGFIFPRSSVSKKDVMLANAVGVIDAPYRGEIKLRFKFIPDSDGDFIDDYKVGDRIGQLIILPLPEVTLVEVDELGDSERGDGGFGSSGS